MKTVLIDREAEKAFIIGDKKVIAKALKISHRTFDKMFADGVMYRELGRWIIIKDPVFIKSRRGGLRSTSHF